MNLNPHQSGTVDYLERRCINQHGLLVFHHMGTGKTNTAIAWLVNRKRKYAADDATAKTKTKHKDKVKKVPHRSSRVASSKARVASTASQTRTRTRTRTRKSKSKNKPRTKSREARALRRTERRALKEERATRRHGGTDSSAESESESETEGTGSGTGTGTRKRAPLAPTEERAFEYIIVCPENIKSTWIAECAMMGFQLDPKCLMDYDQLRGLIQARALDVRGKNLILDEAHNLCPTMRAEEMKFYTEVLHRFNDADKLLLLTGTPEHKEKSDLTILVNLIAGRNEFPLNQKDLLEKYRDRSVFEERKTSFFFNWVKPAMYPALKKLIRWVGSIITVGIYGMVRKFFRKELKLSLLTVTKAQIKRMKKAQGIATHDEEEEDDEEEDSKEAGGGFQLPAVAQNAANFFAKETQQYGKDVLTGMVPTDMAEVTKMAGRHVLGMDQNAMFSAARSVTGSLDKWMYNVPGAILWSFLLKYANSVLKVFQVEQDVNRALRAGKFDFPRFAKDLGRYISLYSLDKTDVNFGSSDVDNATKIESAYTGYQSRQCLFFMFATMDLNMVKFYADCNADEAILKINDFRHMTGVEKYGRCVSNTWELVDDIVAGRVKHSFDSHDGTVKLRYSKKHAKRIGKHRTEKATGGGKVPVEQNKFKDCPKFDAVVKMLRKADTRGERSLVRSDFKAQGIYLMSAYLKAHDIPHYYIRSTITPEERTRILNEYNDVYRPIVAKGKAATLVRDYVLDDYPLDDPRQLLPGALVEAVGGASPEGWDGQTEGQITTIEPGSHTCEVLAKGSLESVVTPVDVLRRAYTVRFDGEKGFATVYAKDIAYPLPPIDPAKAPRKVILLDNDSSEGISLMGVEHVHLLEPLQHSAQKAQVLARAIRFRSHLHLPMKRRNVKVYTHVGVINLAGGSQLDQTKAAFRAQLFDTEKNAHINKHFAGIVPRAAKGTYKEDPVGYLFDQYFNTVKFVHPEFDEDSATPDSMVYEDGKFDTKHTGTYTRHMRRTNVLAKTFETPDDCEQDHDFVVKEKGYGLDP